MKIFSVTGKMEFRKFWKFVENNMQISCRSILFVLSLSCKDLNGAGRTSLLSVNDAHFKENSETVFNLNSFLK